MRETPAPRRPRPARRVTPGLLLLILAPCWPIAAASGPTELRKLHALLVIDTLSGLGESVKVDGERVDHLLSDGLPKDRADIRVITGKDVSAAGILAYYRGLKVGRDDALFFYYAGHGATDPKKGQFLALQDLATDPLPRSDLRRAMLAHQPKLAVIMTDCCSTRYELPNKQRRVWADVGTARELDPVLRGLLFQARGVVDITASSGDASFGDDHDGGIFTRTFARLVHGGVPRTDEDGDGLVTWPEFFDRLQAETENVFVTWAQRQRARGEDVGQTSQKPHAFDLGGAEAVRIRNDSPKPMQYSHRWAGEPDWRDASIEPRGLDQHFPPRGRGVEPPNLMVRFEGGKLAELKAGKTYRFHDPAGSRAIGEHDGSKP